MEKAELRRIVDANDWLWAQWWPALLELSPQQAHQEVGGSFPSVFATTAHMVGAEMVWLERLQGNPEATFSPAPAEMQGLHENWQQLATRRQQWLTTADLEAKITYRFTGGTASNSVAEIVLHFTSHAHFHRGQLASQLRLLGLQPPLGALHWVLPALASSLVLLKQAFMCSDRPQAARAAHHLSSNCHPADAP